MRFDIYGRFRVEMIREDDRWLAYRIGEGVRRPDPDVQIPPEVDATEMVQALEDVFHEFAQPGRSIQRLSSARGES